MLPIAATPICQINFSIYTVYIDTAALWLALVFVWLYIAIMLNSLYLNLRFKTLITAWISVSTATAL